MFAKKLMSLTLAALGFTGSIALAQDESAAQPDSTTTEADASANDAYVRKTTFLACGGFQFSALYVNTGGNLCFDRKLNRYLVNFLGGGIAANKVLFHAFGLRIRDDGSVVGVYDGGNVGGYGKLGIGAHGGFFAKSNVVGGSQLTGNATLVAVGRGSKQTPGFDVGAQAMVISRIR